MNRKGWPCLKAKPGRGLQVNCRAGTPNGSRPGYRHFNVLIFKQERLQMLTKNDYGCNVPFSTSMHTRRASFIAGCKPLSGVAWT
ncbi:hypothetical protein KM92DES2_12256 [uncultured Desulfovibrio sp.]|uniref:Uncharacterized protein n=1 Tax=uncultured Desulfovibrio sp. TaxID=167968 RepID=A0A212K5B3_9BACT|nr:hypothetical protein KM92DES2_12256 [uncultured Desulfovibrio sp.]